MDKLELVYFLGQVGHESAGLKPDGTTTAQLRMAQRSREHAMAMGSSLLARLHPVLVGPTIRLCDYLQSIGQADPNIMAIGKTWSASVTPGALAVTGGAITT